MPSPAAEPSSIRSKIKFALLSFSTKPLPEAARAFFDTLGYASKRTLEFGSVDNFCRTYDSDGSKLGKFNPTESWKSVHLLFQLTGPDIALSSGRQLDLLPAEPADLRQIESYLFVALEFKRPDGGENRTRTELAALARAINRLFPMPALLLIKDGNCLSIAITYRRGNKKDRTKDVVERKVTLIKDVSIRLPHPGHLAIVEDFSLASMSAYRGRDIRTFADLDTAWRESLSVELLRKRAYEKLRDWYFWAREHAKFPPDALPDADGKPSLHLIRLLTRVIFCWFVKEKTLPDGRPLLPYDLFDPPRIRELLKDTSPDAGTYYTAVLQNLFFATLNTEMDPPGGQPATRRFARKVTADHMVHTLWRHEDQLRDPSKLVALLRGVPFLNGGLFECLDDRVEIESSTQTREVRVDGFSTNPAKQPRIPNFLFFGEGPAADLSVITGDSARDHVTVTPLLDILNGFVWTITESTPLEEEVALDPDLLGNVFENLLAAYNPETGTVARNATGSFYTPDYVVDWMIDQALEPLLLAALPSKSKKNAARIGRLLDWNEPGHDFDPSESRLLIDAISRLRSLDPACGSGAYPMGLLKKMVRVLTKLDPNNRLWEQRQRDLAEQLTDTAREDALAAIARAFSRKNDDYGRKLYLIENSIYGVDIQPLAVQIAKLRFFITLIVDQPIVTDPEVTNYGILPLPNLETKIVPANTLLGLQRGQLLLGSDEVRALERELKNVRHRYFTARRYQDKKNLRRRDRYLCKQLATALVDAGECTPSDAKRLVEWNPYNTNTYAGFFDPGWMFGLEGQNGEPGKFDLVIGNPPYVRQEALKSETVRDSAGKNRALKDVLKEQYECYTGTADLYVYFFERSLQLLRIGGVLSFITSNKYFRAGYGEKLRAYLLYATAPRGILDFGDTDIFTAIAYPCILVTEKVCDIEKGQLPSADLLEKESDLVRLVPHAERDFPVFAWRPGPSKVDFPLIFDRDSFALRQRDLKPSSWRLEGASGISLLDRIRKKGTPLGDYVKGRGYWGIKTGLNEAFVVDRETRDRLIDEHKSSAQVLKPFLRGRDVKRWRCEPQDLWLIYIPWHFPLHLDASIKGASREAEKAFAKGFPAIYHHLLSHKSELEARNAAETGIRYEWYALQRWGAEYWQEFDQPKIVVPAISDTVNVAVDFEGYFANNKASIFVSDEAQFLAAVVNSPIAFWFTRQVFATKQGGFWDFEPRYSSQWPIPAATPEQKVLCEALSGMLIELHKSDTSGLPERGLMVTWFEQWLNGLIYELFFPDELHARQIHLFAESAKPENSVGPLADLDTAKKLSRLTTCFRSTYDVNHPLRRMLFDLRSIEIVRMIEAEA